MGKPIMIEKEVWGYKMESGWGQGMMMYYKGVMEKTIMIVKGVVGGYKMKLVWGYSMVMDYMVILMCYLEKEATKG